jgi:hypothetical protein
MIRNDRGNELLLISQDAHARLAGELVGRMGNQRFDGPDPFSRVVLAADLHDAGWALHDEPGGDLGGLLLNADGLPCDVLETRVEVSTRVWRASADRASEEDPYAGLLVSLHGFALSGLATRQNLSADERYALRHDVFLLNQFQQYEIERQERLRDMLGLAIDRPLEMGLAVPGVDREEDRLRFNLAMLRLADAISLEACEGRSTVSPTQLLHPRIGSPTLELGLSQPSPGVIRLSPWPFGVGRIATAVPARCIPKRAYSSPADWHAAYANATVCSWTVLIEPG